MVIAVSPYTAKTQCRKFETNIPRKGIARPQSQFSHLCVCERFIYSHNQSACSAAGKKVDRSWEYINCSQTHECVNWDLGLARKGIHRWDFRCSVVNPKPKQLIHRRLCFASGWVYRSVLVIRVSTDVTFWHSAEYGRDFRCNSGEIPRNSAEFRGISPELRRNVVKTVLVTA